MDGIASAFDRFAEEFGRPRHAESARVSDKGAATRLIDLVRRSPLFLAPLFTCAPRSMRIGLASCPASESRRDSLVPGIFKLQDFGDRNGSRLPMG